MFFPIRSFTSCCAVAVKFNFSRTLPSIKLWQLGQRSNTHSLVAELPAASQYVEMDTENLDTPTASFLLHLSQSYVTLCTILSFTCYTVFPVPLAMEFLARPLRRCRLA